MAELLVRAKGHWMDEFTKEQIDALDAGKKKTFDARCQIGDVVVVRPDGWKWGNEECLPTFLVIKLPNTPVKDVKHYEEKLLGEEDDPIGLKYRKHYISLAEVEKKSNEVKDLEKITPVEMTIGETVRVKDK